MRPLALGMALFLTGCATYSPIRHQETREVVDICQGLVVPQVGGLGWGFVLISDMVSLMLDHSRCVKDARAKGYLVEYDWFDPAGQPEPIRDPMEGHQNWAAPTPKG